jgi:hypothetical protein
LKSILTQHQNTNFYKEKQTQSPSNGYEILDILREKQKRTELETKFLEEKDLAQAKPSIWVNPVEL